MTGPLTVASLSSGYGGLEMALSLWLGEGASRVLWHAETDPDASLVLKTHHPEVPNLGDFTVPGFWERAERAHAHVGGIPCQPFSAAGRQQGEADARHLWPFWRQGIALHRPATIVFENVANLTRGKMRAIFDGIVQDLVDLGYDVRWCILGACAVGAAHHRHRVFLLACRSRTTPHARQVEVATCGQKAAAYLPTPRALDHTMGPASRKSDGGVNGLSSIGMLLPTPASRDGQTRGEGSAEFWERRRELGGTRAVAGVTLGAAVTLLATPQARDAIECRLSPETAARREAAGRRNLDDSVALLPTVRANDATRGPAAGGRTRPEGNGQDLAQVLVSLLPSPRSTDARNGGPSQGITAADGRERPALSSAVQPERWGRYAEAIARHEAVLGRPAPEPTELGPKGGRRLTAAFSEWLMMLPAGHLTSVLERNPALARAGNGVVPLQAATALGLLFADLTRH